MKLNLGCGNDIRVGYLNVDIVGRADIPPSVYLKADVSNLDSVAVDGCVEEIVAMQVIQGIAVDKVKAALENWHKKLSANGILKIMCLNLRLLCESVATDRIDYSMFEQLVFGENGGNKNAVDATHLLNFLVHDLKMTLLCKRQNGYFTYFEVAKS